LNEKTIDPQLGITMCICTANRPETLARCLESLANGIAQPAQILVSDDSPDGTATQAVCAKYGVQYLRGPRRGLCANRNSLVKHVTTSHLSLVDDDAVVAQNFVSEAMPLLKPESEKEIITGDVYESGVLVKPTNSSFWGYFTEPPIPRNETIHLNCNIFPRSAFDFAVFDESIVYGYEDMDLCFELLSKGFHIKYFPILANDHIRPNGVPVKRFRQKEQARFYVALKRYLFWQKSLPNALIYMVLAPLQRAGHSMKVKDWDDLKFCIPDMATAVRDVMRERKRLRTT
jgi:glycosyltransferase involved in cell wall biosynthesis